MGDNAANEPMVLTAEAAARDGIHAAGVDFIYTDGHGENGVVLDWLGGGTWLFSHCMFCNGWTPLRKANVTDINAMRPAGRFANAAV